MKKQLGCPGRFLFHVRTRKPGICNLPFPAEDVAVHSNTIFFFHNKSGQGAINMMKEGV